MQVEWIVKKGNRNALIIFSGWSTDSIALKPLTESLSNKYDILVVWNYTSLDFPTINTQNYDSVSLIAWSFGVWVADRVGAMLPSLQRTISLCGTLYPNSDDYGIPVKMLALTERSLPRTGIEAFNIKMFGQTPITATSQRAFEDQTAELSSLCKAFQDNPEPTNSLRWNFAVIASRDNIFPADNCFRFWNEKSIFAPIKAELDHYPFCKEGVKLVDELLERQ